MTKPAAKAGGVRRIFSNLRALLAGKAGAGLLSLIYLVATARSLGKFDYGLLITVHGYVTLVGGVVAFSGFHGIVRYGTDALASRDHGRFLRLVRFMTVVELGCGGLAILVAMLLAPLVGPALEWNSQTIDFAILYSFAVLANVRATPHGILQLAGRFDLLGYHQLISPLVRITGVGIALLTGGGLYAFLTAWLVAAIAEGASLWIMGGLVLRRMGLSAPWLGSFKGTRTENAGLLPFIATTNADITLGELAPRAAPIIVGWILGPAEAGLLSLAQRASVIIQQPSLLLGQASFSVMADLASEGHVAALKASVRKSFALVTAASVPVVLLLLTFADEVLALLGGASFEDGATLLVLIAAARATTAGAPLLASGITALGRPSLTIAVNLARSLGLLPLLPLFLMIGGLNGAGWHMIVQSLLYTIGLGLILVRLQPASPTAAKP